MTFTPEFLFQIVVALGSGFGAYAAIRADLSMLHERTKTTKESADKAHERINDIISKGATQ